MSCKCQISLTKTVDDLDKAKDWYEEIKQLLQGHTECDMYARAANHQDKVEITK